MEHQSLYFVGSLGWLLFLAIHPILRKKPGDVFHVIFFGIVISECFAVAPAQLHKDGYPPWEVAGWWMAALLPYLLTVYVVIKAMRSDKVSANPAINDA